MNGTSLTTALILSLSAGLATGLGGLVVFFRRKIGGGFLAGALGFSAGVMLFISLVELFQESREFLSLHYGPQRGQLFALLAFFGGIAAIALIDRLIPEQENPHEMNITGLDDVSPKDRSQLMRLGIFSALAIAVHNFPEGMATFAGAMESPEMGFGIAFAVAIHNIPEGIAVAVPIYYATRSRSRAIGNSLLSGLAEPVGGVAGYFLLSFLFRESFLGIVLASVAGIMVYISLDELLPTAEKYGRHHIAIGGLIAGMAFMGVSLLLI